MKNPYVPLDSEITMARFESDDHSLKTIDLKLKDAKNFDFIPGQFCEISILGKGEAPFGIASAPFEEYLRFTINRAGVVTTEIHHLEKGDTVGLRGPLGNGYPVKLFEGKNIVVVSGGFAFTTLRSLVMYLLKERNKYGDITVIYGARRPDLLLYRDELEQWEKRDDMKLYLCIDWKFGDKGPIEEPAQPGWQPINLKDPSKTKIKNGTKRFTAFVPQLVSAIKPDKKDAYAVVCGPPIMIKFTMPVLKELGFSSDKIYNSLERRMKCGFGKCGRCNIGPKYVCKDGPVFSLKELENLPKEY